MKKYTLVKKCDNYSIVETIDVVFEEVFYKFYVNSTRGHLIKAYYRNYDLYSSYSDYELEDTSFKCFADVYKRVDFGKVIAEDDDKSKLENMIPTLKEQDIAKAREQANERQRRHRLKAKNQLEKED